MGDKTQARQTRSASKISASKRAEDVPLELQEALAAVLMSFLRLKSLDELASAGRDALLPAFLPLPLLSTEAAVQAAESQLLSESRRSRL